MSDSESSASAEFGSSDDDVLSESSSDDSARGKKKTSKKAPVSTKKKAVDTKRLTKTLSKGKNNKENVPSSASKAAVKRKISSPPAAAPAAKKVSAVSSGGGAIESDTGNATASIVDCAHGPPVTTDAAAKKLVLQYLKQQNRPYSLIQIFDNLRQRVPKPTLDRALTALSGTGGGICCKEYGKAKIYFVDQSTLPSTVSESQLEAIRDENDALKATANEAAIKEKHARTVLQQLTQEPCDEELDNLLREKAQIVKEKESRVHHLSNTDDSNANITGTEHSSGLKAAVQEHNYFRKMWQARRLICMDTVDLLSEGLNKKPKDVIAELCLETDNEARVALPAVIPEPAQ